MAGFIGAAGGNASGWGDPRAAADPRAAVAAVAAMDGMRDGMRDGIRGAAAAVGLDHRQLDPREQMRQMTGGDMRGDPRGELLPVFRHAQTNFLFIYLYFNNIGCFIKCTYKMQK